MTRAALLISSVLLAVYLAWSGQQLFLQGHLGHDYTFMLPRLLYGYFWFVENGWFSIPWYSPAWCGGLPFYPDPQVMLFSLPQALLWIVDPVHAVYVTYVVFGLLGGLGMFLLLNRTLAVSAWLSFLGACLFAFNEFYLVRMFAGHLTYHVFMLIPLVAWATISGAIRDGAWRHSHVLFAGVLIAMVVHGGAGNFIVPFMLSVTTLMLLFAITHEGSVARLCWSFILSSALGLLLSLSKIVAGYAFVSHFPRESMALGVFSDPGNGLASVFTMLFMNPWLSLGEITREFVVQSHELRFGVTLVPLVLFVIGLAALPTLLRGFSFSRLVLSLCLILLIAVPVVLVMDSPGRDEILKSLPYFREMGLALRWLALLIPVVIVLPLLLVQQLGDSLTGGKATFEVSIAIPGILFVLASHWFTENRHEVIYVPDNILRGYEAVRGGGSVPAVTTIAHDPAAETFVGVDDVFLDGKSSLLCYQPVFGYGLENFPVGRLRPGPIFSRMGAELNLKNPACYLYPGANRCQPGEHFTAAQETQVARFTSLQPYDWQKPFVQELADWINIGVLVLTLLLLPVSVFRAAVLKRS